MPSAIKHRPTLDLTELPYWEAFQTLHMSRPSTGFGPGPIPLTEILSYAELNELPRGEERQDLTQVIRTLDCAYLNSTLGKKHA